MRELTFDEMNSVEGGWWQVVAAVAAVAVFAWENRADLMEVGDAAAAKNQQLNDAHK